MNRRNTFIPLDIQCFWCNGKMDRGTTITGTLNCVTYFCKQCGGGAKKRGGAGRMSEWISVKDRLPEEDGTMRGYLVAVGNWVGIMPFFSGAFREGLNGKEPDYPVHHWMPLPEPPKEEKV